LDTAPIINADAPYLEMIELESAIMIINHNTLCWHGKLDIRNGAQAKEVLSPGLIECEENRLAPGA